MTRSADRRYHIAVLDSLPGNPGDLSWAPLQALGELSIWEQTAPEQLHERIADATVIVTNKVRLDAEAIAAATRCRLICSFATGFDQIDTAAATARGMVVTNVPAYSSATTAQLAIALLLALAHRVEAHSERVHAGDWSKAPQFSWWLSPQHELAGRRMLVVGGGNIGQRVGAIAGALGMEVHFAGLPGRPERGDRVPWLEAIARADVISLHVPLTPETRELVNAESIAAMKPGVWIVNAARGAVVDEAAMAQALQSGQVGAYATDVLSQEPPPADHPLIGAPNCLITPHLGWVTREARNRLILATAASIQGLASGELVNVVARP